MEQYSHICLVNFKHDLLSDGPPEPRLDSFIAIDSKRTKALHFVTQTLNCGETDKKKEITEEEKEYRSIMSTINQLVLRARYNPDIKVCVFKSPVKLEGDELDSLVKTMDIERLKEAIVHTP